jgi:hypothetical protein
LGLVSGQFTRSAPALGSSNPSAFSVSHQIAGFAFWQSTNNLLVTLRKLLSVAWRVASFAPGRPNRSGREGTKNGNGYTRLSFATRVSWKEKGSDDYKTRTEWHRVICWNKLAERAGALQRHLR